VSVCFSSTYLIRTIKMKHCQMCKEIKLSNGENMSDGVKYNDMCRWRWEKSSWIYDRMPLRTLRHLMRLNSHAMSPQKKPSFRQSGLFNAESVCIACCQRLSRTSHPTGRPQLAGEGSRGRGHVTRTRVSITRAGTPRRQDR
jgi:hypothetical protein